MRLQVINFLSALKNASMKSTVRQFEVAYSGVIVNWLKLLYTEGFIRSYYIKLDPSRVESGSFEARRIVVVANGDLCKNLKIISSPSIKRYFSYRDLCRLSINMKGRTCFLSTDEGYVTLEYCLKNRLGGVLAFII